MKHILAKSFLALIPVSLLLYVLTIQDSTPVVPPTAGHQSVDQVKSSLQIAPSAEVFDLNKIEVNMLAANTTSFGGC